MNSFIKINLVLGKIFNNIFLFLEDGFIAEAIFSIIWLLCLKIWKPELLLLLIALPAWFLVLLLVAQFSIPIRKFCEASSSSFPLRVISYFLVDLLNVSVMAGWALGCYILIFHSVNEYSIARVPLGVLFAIASTYPWMLIDKQIARYQYGEPPMDASWFYLLTHSVGIYIVMLLNISPKYCSSTLCWVYICFIILGLILAFIHSLCLDMYARKTGLIK